MFGEAAHDQSLEVGRDGRAELQRRRQRFTVKVVLADLADVAAGKDRCSRAITVEELISAHRHGTLHEVFGCRTAAVITPVGELGLKGETLVVNGGQPGVLAKCLLTAITDVQYGRAPDTHGWMTVVQPGSRLHRLAG